MTDPPVVQESVHPRSRLVLPACLLLLAGGIVFYDLTHSNRVHELDSTPYAAGLTVLSTIFCLVIVRSLGSEEAQERGWDKGWRTLAGTLSVVSAAAALGALMLLSDWIAAQ